MSSTSSSSGTGPYSTHLGTVPSSTVVLMVSASEPGVSRSQRKRVAITEAATEGFLAAGYRGTSMDEIAAAAGVSKQTLYKQFSDKAQLFTEVVQAMVDAAGDPGPRRRPRSRGHRSPGDRPARDRPPAARARAAAVDDAAAPLGHRRVRSLPRPSGGSSTSRVPLRTIDASPRRSPSSPTPDSCASTIRASRPRSSTGSS